MPIKEVIQTINRMRSDGVIERYSFGGAVGATFYLEPLSTLEVDVSVEVRTRSGSALISLEPVFTYLRQRGCTMEREYVVISGWPVQFLRPTGSLIEEALANAVEVDIEGTSAQVFAPEYLAAIALETGRAKDKVRLLQFIEADAFNQKRFQEILARHGLSGQWEKFERQFPK